MIEVAGGILLAILILVLLPVLAVGIWWLLLAICFAIPIVALVLILLWTGPDLASGALIWLPVYGAIGVVFIGLAKLQDHLGGSISKGTLAAFRRSADSRKPILGPQDPRHADNLDWANRRGEYGSM